MKRKLKKDIANAISCGMLCGDGTGKEPKEHLWGCPKASLIPLKPTSLEKLFNSTYEI